jgi:hypothetical protein
LNAQKTKDEYFVFSRTSKKLVSRNVEGLSPSTPLLERESILREVGFTIP